VPGVDVQVAPHIQFVAGKWLQGGYGREKRMLMKLFLTLWLCHVAQSD
jgi:hypothetical protein